MEGDMATRRKNGDETSHLMLLALHEIRDVLKGHDERFASMDERLHSLEQSTIDGFSRVREALDLVNVRIDATNAKIDRLTDRFENMNETISSVVRDQGKRLVDVEVRLARLESRARD
jgi:hypothetical protein